MVEKEKDDENKAEVDGNEEVQTKLRKAIWNRFNRRILAGIMHKSNLSECFRQNCHTTHVAEVGDTCSGQINDVDRVHGKVNIQTFRKHLTNALLTGSKVCRRSAGRRKDSVARNRNNILLAKCLGHQLQKDYQPGQEVGMWLGFGEVQRQKAWYLQSYVS